jgi:SAM-dependent methyltransferase
VSLVVRARTRLGPLRRRIVPLRRDLPPRERLGLTQLEPVSRTFGQDRGTPIDRWYIERFLGEHAADVTGRVLEVAEPTYTRRFGDDRVTRSDVLHAARGNPEATLVGDLTTGEGLPEDAFDCFICTQTLQFVFDVGAAVDGARRLLKPGGGVLLATVPGISQISREDRRRFGEWWRFTTESTTRLFGDAFGAEHVEVTAHGNVLVAAAFLYGFAAEELDEAQLRHRDPDFDFLMTVRARRTPGHRAPGRR